MGHINHSLMKIVYGMLGLIGGQLGAEFFKKQFATPVVHADSGSDVVSIVLDTPWYLTSGVYVVISSGIFVSLSLWSARKQISRAEKIIYVLLIVLLFYGSGLRVYFYAINMPIPGIFDMLSNTLYVSISLAISARAWSLSNLPYRWMGKERRKSKRDQNACSIDGETT